MKPLFIRVECDWGAEGLWNERGAAYSVANLPLSIELRERILAWQEKFDDEAKPWSNNDTYDWDAHQREGEAIARLVKTEIHYADVVAFDRRINPDGSLGERVPFPGESPNSA